jgi:hypothetical protein
MHLTLDLGLLVIYGNLSIEGPNLHNLSSMRESGIASIEI